MPRAGKKAAGKGLLAEEKTGLPPPPTHTRHGHALLTTAASRSHPSRHTFFHTRAVCVRASCTSPPNRCLDAAQYGSLSSTRSIEQAVFYIRQRICQCPDRSLLFFSRILYVSPNILQHCTHILEPSVKWFSYDYCDSPTNDGHILSNLFHLIIKTKFGHCSCCLFQRNNSIYNQFYHFMT